MILGALGLPRWTVSASWPAESDKSGMFKKKKKKKKWHMDENMRMILVMMLASNESHWLSGRRDGQRGKPKLGFDLN